MAKKIENQYLPDSVSPPGDSLLETLEYLGMTQAELAERTGRPKKTISEIIQGKAAITPETALQLEAVLGTPASFWNNREKHYRESLARNGERSQLEEKTEWLNTLPVAAMIAQGWICKCGNAVDQLKEVLRFYGVASPDAWQDVYARVGVAYRQSKAFESDPGAVSAWLRQGEIEAQSVSCRPYDGAAFRAVLSSVRTLTVEHPEVFSPKLVAECAAAGVAVVFIPELPKSRVCGATRWLTPEKALIQLSLRYRTNDHFWFTFFHEACHILKHGKREAFIESKDDRGAKEVEADRFACDFLIPRAQYDAFVRAADFQVPAIREFASRIGIAPGIVVGRLQHDKHLAFSQFNSLKQTFVWKPK